MLGIYWGNIVELEITRETQFESPQTEFVWESYAQMKTPSFFRDLKLQICLASDRMPKSLATASNAEFWVRDFLKCS